MTRYRLHSYIYLTIVSMIWGAAGPIIKFTLGAIDPLIFLGYRFTISGIFALAYFILKKPHFPSPKKSIPYSIFYGLLAFTLALGFLFLGLDKTSILNTTIISLLGPLMVVAGGSVLFHDHITKKEKLGIGIVLTGIVVATVIPLINGHIASELTGNILIFLFVVADAAAALVAKRLVQQKIDAFTLTNFGLIVGAATIIPFALVDQGFSTAMSQIMTLPFKYHLGVWYMALISGTLAYFLFILGQKSIEVSEAIIFRYLGPIFAVPLAVFWLGEEITGYFIIGAGITLVGIFIAEYKKSS